LNGGFSRAMARGAPDFLLSDRYDTLSALMAFQGPILIIHGAGDDVAPVEHALRMKEQIPAAKLILYECGHSDGPPDWNVYWKDRADILGEAGVCVRISEFGKQQKIRRCEGEP